MDTYSADGWMSGQTDEWDRWMINPCMKRVELPNEWKYHVFRWVSGSRKA